MPVQITFNFLTPVPLDFVNDANTAAAILAATFTNNITLTFNVRFGLSALGNPLAPLGANAAINPNTAIYTNYTTLRNNLLSFGQPNFFTPTNVPAGNTLDGMTNFYIPSSVAKAFGIPNIPAGVDGSIGIGTGWAAGTGRVNAFLHEITHAMGRISFNQTRDGVTYNPEFDLMRFSRAARAPGQVPVRVFDGTNPSAPNRPAFPAYFSIDGGVTTRADWGIWSDPADFINPQIDSTLPGPYSDLTPNDAFNELVRNGGIAPLQLTTEDILATEALGFTSTLPVVNPAPPAGTTAVMVLRQTSASVTDGTYNIYDLGNNQILANFQLGKVAAPWQFVTLGGFNDGDTSDMMLRNPTTNQFLLYDIANNNNNFTPGGAGISLIPPNALGSEWRVLAFGNFSSLPGATDMMLRRSSDGLLLIEDISNNQITNSIFTGPVGPDWQFAGVGNFSSNPDGVARDLILRRASDGALQLYNIANNQLVPSTFFGPVAGPEWQFSGVGNFSSVPGESDLLLRRVSDGALQLYNIANNQLVPSTFIGPVGPDFTFAGVASIRGAGPASDLVLRRASDGFLQVYNIANNALGPTPPLGATGADWQLGGFAPTAGAGGGMGGQAAQLAQAMAGLGGSTADTSNAIDGNAVGSPVDPSAFSSAMLNPAPPDATTANMVLRNASTTTASYEIYNLGANSILAGSALAQVGSDWGFVTLGNFNLSDPSDMLLRNSTSGAFQVYDIADNNVISSSSLGTVGSNWQVMGFGTFGPFAVFGETDMLLRDVNTGKLQVYNIDNNQITKSFFIGTVGTNWQFSGIGNFSGVGTSDLLVRNSNTGGLQVYNISNNQITGSAFIGTVGTDWQFSGVGNFSSVPDESDLLLRNSKTGELEVLNINNNQVTGAASIGTIGLDWQFAGVAPVHAETSSDLVLRNVNTGAFQVYNIANNKLMGSASLGQVGPEWQLGGFAPTTNSGPEPEGPSGDPLGSSSQPAAMDGSPSQLVQAMAGFGGSAAISNTAPLGTEASQQPLLTTPQHA
jgi:hypothetical protein